MAMRRTHIGGKVGQLGRKAAPSAALVVVALALTMVLAPHLTNGAPLPPVGQRAYILDAAKPTAPVEIKRDTPAATAPSGKKQVVLRDPTFTNGPVEVVVPKKLPPRKPAKPVGMKAGQLKFGKVRVAGHLKRPRVDFTQETIPVERADEPLREDFYDKVFAPVSDDSF
jgi:hypothetical protein